MIQVIKNALLDQGIATWRINCEKLQAAELYFIKKNLDTRRMIDTTTYEVTVFNDFEKDGAKFRGHSTILIAPGMDVSSVNEKIKNAYFAASFVANPFFELPKPLVANPIPAKGKAASMTLSEVCDTMVAALYKTDCEERSWINSAELFVNRKEISILSSAGTDVSYAEYDINGEFVVQAREPKDVEIHQQFAYTDLEPEALSEQAKTALETVQARAAATQAPKKGNYNIILSEKAVVTLMSYYAERSHVGYIYPGYSDWKKGTSVQGDDVTGEKVNLTFLAKTPYSREGIAMQDMPLVEDGVLANIHGPARLSYYLGVEPTGEFSAVKSTNGTISFEEMKKEPYLHVVTFSDFHMDSMSGYFGGEIRLAYLYDGETVTPVTGGSINGYFIDLQKDMTFSTERYVNSRYDGPRAVLLKNVPVAGQE